MVDLWLVVAGLVVGFGALAAVVLLRARAGAVTRERLGVPDEPAAPVPTSRAPADPRPFVRRYSWLPWLVAVGVFAALYFGVSVKLAYAVMPALAVGLLGGELDRMRVAWQEALIEAQLADAIDMMVGVLRAGGGVSAALESAARETRWPLQPQLAEVIGRIRLGDEPRAVIRDLTARVPLENFVLFASALSVHWEVGGSLAGSLATVGKTIRDRIELDRRIRSQTAQAKASVLAVLAATYFIGIIIWRNNPERMVGFLSTQIGSWLVAFAVLLQVVGVVWSLSASRVRF